MTRLKRAREAASMTLLQTARAAGVTLRSYQRFDAGERIPRADVAVKIAKALGTTVEKLFGTK